MTISQRDKANKVNSNHKLDKEDKAHKHIATINKLRCKGILYLSIVSQDILEKNLYLNYID